MNPLSKKKTKNEEKQTTAGHSAIHQTNDHINNNNNNNTNNSSIVQLYVKLVLQHLQGYTGCSSSNERAKEDCIKMSAAY